MSTHVFVRDVDGLIANEFVWMPLEKPSTQLQETYPARIVTWKMRDQAPRKASHRQCAVNALNFLGS